MNKDGKTVRFPQPQPDRKFLSLPTHNMDNVSIVSQTLSDVPSDIIIKSHIKYGNRLSACKGLIMEYSKRSTIHGFRYLFEVHRPIYEKIYWFVLMAISFYFAVSWIWDTYLKWQDSPVILGFDTLVPVHEIPFPTITICPETKMKQRLFSFKNVSQKMWEDIQEFGAFENRSMLTQEELDRLAAVLQICDPEVVERFAQYIPPNITPDISNTLVDLSVTKNLTAPFCKWNGRFYFCNYILNFVPTDEGICYQFNGLQNKDLYRDERFMSYTDEQVIDFNYYFDDLPPYNNVAGNWSLENGYLGQGYNSYPQRTVFTATRNGFFAYLQGFEHNFDYACRSSKQGYKVYLNSPESVPLTSGNYILVSHSDEVKISLLPEYIMATDNLHDFEPAKRQCYFNHERYLRYFRSYSQNNCQTECLTNFTISKCGCAKFWMPKPMDIPVCGIKSIDCLKAAEEELNMLLQTQTIQKSTNPEIQIQCDCMPSCTSLEYNFEISRSYFDFEKIITAFREEYEHTDAVASRLLVHFKEHQFIAIRRCSDQVRSNMFSVTILIANCAGIFGLFMGISNLSIIELIYFFSIRLFNNQRKRRAKKKKLLKQQSGVEN